MKYISARPDILRAIKDILATDGVFENPYAKKKYKKLREEVSKLDPYLVTAKELDKILRNVPGFNPRTLCDECGKLKDEAVLFEWDRELDDCCPYYICKDCLQKALDLNK